MNIVFAGTPAFAVPALDALAASRHRVVGVLTQPDRPAGRGRHVMASPVKERALALGLPVAQPEKLASEAERAALVGWKPELIVVVAYGLLLPPVVLSLPRLGCLNIHASLLPRWRGAAPIQRAILAGDTETGVSLMQLEAGLDTGPVFRRERLAIGAHTTARDLQASLATLGAGCLIEVIEGMDSGALRAEPQAAVGVTHAAKIRKEEARVDWREPALAIDRRIRAFDPWPVAETRAGEARLRLHAARVLDAAPGRDGSPGAGTAPRGVAPPGTVLGLDGDAIVVATGDGRLGITRLQAEGRKTVGAAEFWRAAPLAGVVLQ